MTNGASNDIAVATSTVRSMVQEWGMSALWDQWHMVKEETVS